MNVSKFKPHKVFLFANTVVSIILSLVILYITNQIESLYIEVGSDVSPYLVSPYVVIIFLFLLNLLSIGILLSNKNLNDKFDRFQKDNKLISILLNLFWYLSIFGAISLYVYSPIYEISTII